ncbi:TPR repeat-containing SEL1 subfamily protein [Paramagnetospirillum caucaseum]|uniref:TPR repeat-containing SEL1 subfamily protein n=1 Tax=Paramagnetospirillum caucaseum TaxID=1244869 RepID=M2YFE0_9PROT|nr:SPOR domain-containing protein [Paramagnetospirillum caucaseum]EME71671.1 TPR repeat-containing SEL1 subfamily protein [Paramagnetospirillum caucaseum]
MNPCAKLRYFLPLLALGLLAGCSDAPPPMQTVRDHYFYGGLAAFHEDMHPEAARQWQRAAELGDGEAARNLGHLYRQGLGVEADGHIAAAWYQVAADAGVISAEYNLGMLYMKGGTGLPADPAEGLKRLGQAAAAGFIPAKAELDRLAAPPPPAAAVAAAEPPPSAAEPPAAEPAPLRMQIGSYRTKAAAEQDWKRLRLKTLRPEVVANTVEGQGRWYRLVAVGPPEAVEAFCGSAQAKGMSCWSRNRRNPVAK